jgi:hypothetical protein
MSLVGTKEFAQQLCPPPKIPQMNPTVGFFLYYAQPEAA